MAAAVSLPNPDRFGYLKPKDVARLAEAYRFSEAAHAGQTRQSGDPYISHPLAVAEILADRLHNMRTLGAVPPAKRRRIARETMEIYAPIANRLGLNSLYHELQELAFSHLYPSRYKVLAKATKGARGNRREMIGRTLEAVKRKLSESGIEASVQGREKHVYSTYRKMIEKHLSFSEVHDIFGCRGIVQDVPACYLALGALHCLYKPIPGKF